jgi:hypothetical protein
MEAYVARLAEEMEFLISELGRAVDAASAAAMAAVTAASAVSETENEEG